jgi:cytoskeletal protein RodZ
MRPSHGSRPAPVLRMRKFLVIAVLAGLAWLFVVQKRSEPQKPAPEKTVAQATASASPRPVSEHNWMKHSLDRANEVKRQVAQQRKEDGTR